MSGADTATATFTAPATAAVLVFTLTVTDDSGDSATNTNADTVTITVTAPATALTAEFANITDTLIGQPAEVNLTFSEGVTGLEQTDFSTRGATITGLNEFQPTFYIVSFTPTAASFTLTLAANSVTIISSGAMGPAEPVSVQGTAEVVLEFTAAPELTSNNPVPGSNIGFATVGDILTLTFTVNQALGNTPEPDIAGEPISATKGDGNDYSATWTVTEEVASANDGDLVFFSLGRLFAVGSVQNRLSVFVTDSDIRFDHTAPTVVTFDPIPDVRTIGNALETHTITFSEPVTDSSGDALGIDDFTATGATITDVTSSDQTTYTITFTPTATAFSLTLAANSVADLAGLTGPANDVTASGTAAAATVNQPPVANAGDDQSVTTGVEVTLTGSGSSDPDGRYPELCMDAYFNRWRYAQPAHYLERRHHRHGNLHRPDTAAVLIFTLTVTDDSGDSATNTGTDTVTITVTAPVANTAPVAEAGDPQSVTTGTEVTLTGSATDPDTDDVLTYAAVAITLSRPNLHRPPPRC